jgi:hypothetical protein
MQGGRPGLVIGAAAAIGILVALAFTLHEQSDSTPDGLIVVIPQSTQASAPAARSDYGARTAAAPMPEHRIEQTDADVALLDARFADAPAEPVPAFRAERLRAQLERIMVGDVRFGALQVECRSRLCRLSGSVVTGRKAADHASAFALLHQSELVAIGAAEGLEPGPLAATVSTMDTRFVAYLVSP